MNRLSRLWLPAVLLCAAFAVSACAPKVSTRGAQTPVAAPTSGTFAQADVSKPVPVALLAPRTAENPGAAQIGQALVNAANMGIADLGPGLVDLRIYDTGGTEAQAQAVAAKAVADGARLILGPLFGSNTRAIAQTAREGGVKVLSFSTDARAAGDPVYVTGFLPEVAAARITSFARARGYGRIGVLYPENFNGYGEAALRGAQRGVGAGVVTSTAYARTNDGIRTGSEAFAAAAQGVGANAVLLADSGQALNYIGSVVRSAGLTPSRVKYLGLGEWNSRITLREGSLRGGWFAAPDPTATRAFVEKYQGRFGSVPPVQAVLAYDAVRIAGTLVSESRGAGGQPFTVANLTRGRGFRGAVGPIRLGRDGIGQRSMAILQVDAGIFRTIDAVPVSAAGS